MRSGHETVLHNHHCLSGLEPYRTYLNPNYQYTVNLETCNAASSIIVFHFSLSHVSPAIGSHSDKPVYYLLIYLLMIKLSVRVLNSARNLSFQSISFDRFCSSPIVDERAACASVSGYSIWLNCAHCHTLEHSRLLFLYCLCNSQLYHCLCFVFFQCVSGYQQVTYIKCFKWQTQGPWRC